MHEHAGKKRDSKPKRVSLPACRDKGKGINKPLQLLVVQSELKYKYKRIRNQDQPCHDWPMPGADCIS
jgi:hypothetical protein